MFVLFQSVKCRTISAFTLVVDTLSVERAELVGVVPARRLVVDVVEEHVTSDDHVEVAALDELRRQRAPLRHRVVGKVLGALNVVGVGS